MPIVLFLGWTVKDYIEKSERIIQELMDASKIRCEICLQPMKRHSSYERGIKETGQKITIAMVWCGACRKWHALLPDFLLPGKHYSGNEIESVVIDSATVPINAIETEASESTVRRWASQIGERVRRAVGILKYHFGRLGRAVSETSVVPGTAYSELEQVLDMAPNPIKYSGNKLGLANIWLGATGAKANI